jgi:tetratricopeptide (TPR) repeat protein
MQKIKLLVSLVLFFLVACTSNNKPSISGSSNKTTKTPIASSTYPPYILSLFSDVKQHPDSTGRRLQLAFALDSIGMFSEAMAQMDTLISKDSTNYGLWFKNGEIAEDSKDTSRAMMSYARAIGIYPSPDALLSLANLYSEQRNKKGLEICRQVQQMSLGREYDAHCAFIEGVYYARTRNTEEALEAFDNCIANDYTYMEAYIEKGLVYFDNKQYGAALRIFQFAATVNALDSDPYYWQGRCYEMIGVKDSAILRFRQSLHLEDDSATHAALKRLNAE